MRFQMPAKINLRGDLFTGPRLNQACQILLGVVVHAVDPTDEGAPRCLVTTETEAHRILCGKPLYLFTLPRQLTQLNGSRVEDRRKHSLVREPDSTGSGDLAGPPLPMEGDSFTLTASLVGLPAWLPFATCWWWCSSKHSW
jgi:hypothetical protein